MRKGFEQASEDANQRWTSIQVSRHSYLDAAESMALRKYFVGYRIRQPLN